MEEERANSWRLTIPLTNVSVALIDVLHMGFSLADQVKKSGGKARCLKIRDTITVELTGMGEANLHPLIDAFTASMSRRNESIGLCLERADDIDLNPDENSLAHGEFFRGKLTKRLLMSLPEGVFVVSNRIHSGQPVFAERLKPQNGREQQWATAVKAGAAQTTADVLWHEEDVLECHGVDLRT